MGIFVDPFCGGPRERVFLSSLHFLFEIREGGGGGGLFSQETGCMEMAGAMLVVDQPAMKE